MYSWIFKITLRVYGVYVVHSKGAYTTGSNIPLRTCTQGDSFLRDNRSVGKIARAHIEFGWYSNRKPFGRVASAGVSISLLQHGDGSEQRTRILLFPSFSEFCPRGYVLMYPWMYTRTRTVLKVHIIQTGYVRKTKCNCNPWNVTKVRVIRGPRAF